jgi:hypothetical protein
MSTATRAASIGSVKPVRYCVRVNLGTVGKDACSGEAERYAARLNDLIETVEIPPNGADSVDAVRSGKLIRVGTLGLVKARGVTLAHFDAPEGEDMSESLAIDIEARDEKSAARRARKLLAKVGISAEAIVPVDVHGDDEPAVWPGEDPDASPLSA